MQAQPASSTDHGLKQPHGLSPRMQWLRDYYFEGVAALLEQRVHLLDHRHAVGRPLRRDHLLHRSRDLRVPAGLPAFRAPGRPTGRAPPRLLEVEPARAARLVHPRGHGEVRAAGDPARRSRGRRALQHSRLAVLDESRGPGAEPAGRRTGRRPRGDEVVSRPRLRQRRGDLRTPHSRSRASARDRLEGDPRRPADALRRTVAEREARAQGRAAPGHDDGRDDASRSRRQLRGPLPATRRRGTGSGARAGAAADGAEPRARAVGARRRRSGRPCRRCGSTTCSS